MEPNRLEEYKLAVQLMMYEGHLYWTRFHVMMLLNSGLLAFLGLVSSLLDPPATSTSSVIPGVTFVTAVSLVGIIVSAVWFLTSSRSASIFRYWIKSAQSLEEGTTFNLLMGLDALKKESFFRRTAVLETASIIPLMFMIIWITISVANGLVSILMLIPILLIFILLYFWSIGRFNDSKGDTKLPNQPSAIEGQNKP